MSIIKGSRWSTIDLGGRIKEALLANGLSEEEAEFEVGQIFQGMAEADTIVVDGQNFLYYDENAMKEFEILPFALEADRVIVLRRTTHVDSEFLKNSAAALGFHLYMTLPDDDGTSRAFRTGTHG